MTRKPLPHRRRSATREIVLPNGNAAQITVGFDTDGAPREVFFAGGPTLGTDLHHTIADACVVISIALQHRIGPADLARSLGRVPVVAGNAMRDAPASVIGCIIAVVQAENEPELRALVTRRDWHG